MSERRRCMPWLYLKPDDSSDPAAVLAAIFEEGSEYILNSQSKLSAAMKW